MNMVRTILRRPDVLKALGYSGNRFDELVNQGVVPRPVKLSETGRAIGWFADEIADYQKARAAARDATKARRR